MDSAERWTWKGRQVLGSVPGSVSVGIAVAAAVNLGLQIGVPASLPLWALFPVDWVGAAMAGLSLGAGGMVGGALVQVRKKRVAALAYIGAVAGLLAAVAVAAWNEILLAMHAVWSLNRLGTSVTIAAYVLFSVGGSVLGWAAGDSMTSGHRGADTDGAGGL